MTQYFFDVHDSQLSTYDEEGTECSGRQAISSEALRALCQIAEDHPDRYVGQKLKVTVRDADDGRVLTAYLNLSSAWHAEEEPSQAA